ncbi:cytochrome b pre-mRNA-processing protein 3 [Azospirillum fermentarium]|uniref:ubiquinol-cytochrome C chaperone family protein n=1 Tax=Azospirillum fermentarium TaxID=1233114 RepID=UPI0022268312|nr:ubiquinol-cytochrome C chaperone family protein [Azospirillum fermentarium]MCW2246120.1 cytochrome b pre-mRNA-processing protein 3 [Azospirillum fermentarium]
MFARLLARLLPGRGRDRRPAFDAFSCLVVQARHPEFFRGWGVPDTIDGRFDMVALHVFLLMHRLKGQGVAAEAFSQQVFEVMVADMDHSLRELGAGDTGVGKRVKRMVRGMAGRLQAYDRALAAGGNAALEAALDNNVYGTVADSDPVAVASLAAYVRDQAAHLAAQDVDALMAARFTLAPPPVRG